MDKNSKIRISFNLFDIIIILIVIALVAGFAVYQTRSSSSGGASGTKTVQYQVEITGLTEGTGDRYAKGIRSWTRSRKTEWERWSHLNFIR